MSPQYWAKFLFPDKIQGFCRSLLGRVGLVENILLVKIDGERQNNHDGDDDGRSCSLAWRPIKTTNSQIATIPAQTQ
eukprot:scaffold3069_cov215-Amphora_coffeaeformis.AAC.19